MKSIILKNGKKIPAVAVGCMRISDRTEQEVEQLIVAALDSGINFFDHADIYGGGNSEIAFAKAAGSLKLRREDLIIQTKCGICKGYYDFSYVHIVESLEGSLKRLQVEYVDYLLLHRPDALMEPEEVARAFSYLKESGKVLHFGVSNCNAMQIALLNQATGGEIFLNQLQFGPAHTGMIDSGINVNTETDYALDRDGSILEYCRLNDIHIQAWSPFQYGMFQGVFMNNPKYEKLVSTLDTLAEKYHVSRETMIAAWIGRHPAGIQTITGSTNPARIREIAKAGDITISRPEWYQVYLSAGNPLP